MPRAKRTSARPNRTDQTMPAAPTPTQPAAAPTGMTYGAHNDTIEAQHAIPLPASPSPQASAPPPGQPGPPATGPPGGDFASALQQAMATHTPEDMLSAPSQRPDEPITAGLSSGPGPPPAPVAPPQAASYLAKLAESTGDPSMAELASLAERLSA